MSEYLVVAGALVSSFFIVDNADCPGYDNCVSALAAAFHDSYQGYSNSMSEVHRFYPSSPTLALADDTGASGDAGGGGGTLDPLDGQDGLSNQTVVSIDGGGNFLLGTDGTSVLDSDGNVVGTYSDGQFTPAGGGPAAAASVGIEVVDSEGNIVQPSVIVCFGAVDSFAYVDGGQTFNTVNLTPEGPLAPGCVSDDYVQMENPDGVIDDNAVLYNGVYYPTFFGEPNRAGQVVLFNFAVPDDADKYGAFANTTINDCVVLPDGWDADDSKDDLENYIDAIGQDGVIGSPAGVCEPEKTASI